MPILHYDFYPATSFVLFIGYHDNPEPKLVTLKKRNNLQHKFSCLQDDYELTNEIIEGFTNVE